MTDEEQAILQTLVELENAVGRMATANPKPDLRPLFVRLNELTARLPHRSDPQLIHYLTRGSYEKAKLHLQGRQSEVPPGSCGPGSNRHAHQP